MFDQDLSYPEHIFKLTSDNQGLTYFNMTLVVDEINLEMNGFEDPNVNLHRGRRLISENPYRFTWKVLNTTTNPNEIKFEFKFDNP